MSSGEMVEEQDCDIAIVGAGLSGLCAAYYIWKRDPSLNVILLEAKGRIGGRTIGKEINGALGKEYWDLGGQWIGKCQPHIIELVQELGLQTHNEYTDGKKVMQLGGSRVSTYTGEIPSLPWYSLIDLHLFMTKLERMVKQVSVEDPASCPQAKQWDSMTFQEYLNTMIKTKAAREAVESAGRCIFGVEPSQLSLLYYLTYAAAAGGLEPLISAKEGTGGQEAKIEGGAWQVCHRLLDKIGGDKVQIAEPVSTILQNADGVELLTINGKVVKCQRAILALPPNQIAKIEFSPPLPTETLHVVQRMPVGYLTKLIVTYKTPFWREFGYSGEAVTSGGSSLYEDCESGPLCIIFDATSSRGSPAIVAFIGAKQQLQYSKLKAADRRRAVLCSLAELFGEQALHCIDYCEKNWNEETYNGGCPVCVGTPGMMTYFAPALRQPFNRVHLAGTESATVWCGFLNGAVQSGYRAAAEVLYNIRPQVVSSEDLIGTAYDPARDKSRADGRWRRKSRGRHAVLRWTISLGVVVVLAVVAKKAYFRIAL